MKLNRIRVVLEDKGISQTWLAKKLGRSFSTVNTYVCMWLLYVFYYLFYFG